MTHEHNNCGHKHGLSVFQTQETGWKKAVVIASGSFRLFLCPGDDIAAASVAASSVGSEIGEERNAVLPVSPKIEEAVLFQRPKRKWPIIVHPKRKV